MIPYEAMNSSVRICGTSYNSNNRTDFATANKDLQIQLRAKSLSACWNNDLHSHVNIHIFQGLRAVLNHFCVHLYSMNSSLHSSSKILLATGAERERER